MNPGFVSDYEGCNITTKAIFVRTGSYQTGLEDKYVIIEATPPGEDKFARAIALPKVGSELAFQLKPKETILLRGGTLVTFSKVVPVFVATSIERSR